MQQGMIRETLNSYRKWCVVVQQMEQWGPVDSWMCILMLKWKVMQYHDEQNRGVVRRIQMQGIWRKQKEFFEVRGDGWGVGQGVEY